MLQLKVPILTLLEVVIKTKTKLMIQICSLKLNYYSEY